MKLRAVLEIDVPDEVGQEMLAEQVRKAEERGQANVLKWYVDLGDWSYYVKAPVWWERDG